VLTELPPSQERDELGAQEDADEQRRHAAEEDAPHQRGPRAAAIGPPCGAPPPAPGGVTADEASPTRAPSASATCSRPTPREPFTSTVSPLRSSPGSSSPAARASETECASP